MARSERWEFCFTESFTTLQGQNGQKRIARAMTKEREEERDGVNLRNLVKNKQTNPFEVLDFRPGTRRESHRFVCLSKHDQPRVHRWKEKKAFNLHLTTVFFSFSSFDRYSARECQHRNSFFFVHCTERKTIESLPLRNIFGDCQSNCDSFFVK